MQLICFSSKLCIVHLCPLHGFRLFCCILSPGVLEATRRGAQMLRQPFERPLTVCRADLRTLPGVA